MTAGIREGKNDINARVSYFRVGIDLRTEKPSSSTISAAARRMLTEPRWKTNAMRLRQELSQYRPFEIIEDYLAATLPDPWARRELADAGGPPQRSDAASAAPA